MLDWRETLGTELHCVVIKVLLLNLGPESPPTCYGVMGIRY